MPREKVKVKFCIYDNYATLATGELPMKQFQKLLNKIKKFKT